MRPSIVAFAAVVLATLGIVAPAAVPAAQAATAPKVVIIVGATHDVTASYRADADSAYAEAIKYTSNVVKVYSPNATWTKVKAATTGASIVVYFGHGNGWPSPYTYDAKYTTKDGFGLNYDLNGDGKLSDYENKYYGEPSVATLDLAPNAVVLLSHLCYASGNSEPGNSAPTLTVAKQRVDNYAAGFLKSNAQAVIADGHRGPEGYIRSLFTTKQSILNVWKNQSNFHDHVISFASTRTSGATAYMDPDTATSGYYRSLVTQPGLTSEDVTGVGSGATTTDPSALKVPGNAAVATEGAGLFDDATLTPEAGTGLAAATLEAGARLRLLAKGAVDADSGATPIQVEGIDDPDLDGWMAATDLVARDSTAPAISSVVVGSRVSPNGDGRSDQAALSAHFSETVDWQVRIKNADGTIVFDESGDGTAVATTWDARDGAAAYPNGTYTWSIRAVDSWANGPTTKTGTIVVDTKAPSFTNITPGNDDQRWISPNGDLAKESMTWVATASEGGSVLLKVANPDGTIVRKATITATSGGTSVVWNGKNDDAAVVPDGTYQVRFTPRDLAGNDGKTITRPLIVDTSLGDVDASKTLIYPQDADALAKTTTLRFHLTREAEVTWTIVDAAGVTVRTLLDGVTKPAGTVTKAFDGKRANGTYLPQGTYRSVVTLAGDGAPVISQYRSFTMAAFKISASDTTPGRGQSITINATAAESLSTRPKVTVYQPGKAAWSVSMTKVSTGVYKIKLTIKTGGGSGTVRFKVGAADIDGHQQSTNLSLTLH